MLLKSTNQSERRLKNSHDYFRYEVAAIPLPTYAFIIWYNVLTLAHWVESEILTMVFASGDNPSNSTAADEN